MYVEMVDLEKLKNEEVGGDVDVGIAEAKQAGEDEILPDVRQVGQENGADTVDQNGEGILKLAGEFAERVAGCSKGRRNSMSLQESD